MKRLLSIVLVAILLCAVLPMSASAASYTYDVMLEAQEISDAVTVDAYIDWEFAGCAEWGTPTDIATDNEGNFYITDSENGCILVFNNNFKYVKTIKTLTMPDGSKSDISSPQGLYVDQNKNIYLADTGNKRVIVCDINGVVDRAMTVSAEEIFIKDFVFQPLKVAADKWGNCYVIAKDVFEGLIQIDWKGNYLGYVGSNDVETNIWEIFWRKIATKSQRDQYIKVVPIEFNNIDVDTEGLMFTVTTVYGNLPTAGYIRRQNAQGNDILKTSDLTGAVVGDLELPEAYMGSTAFCDVSASQEYGFSCLDEHYGKIFVYNSDSDFLFAFGGMGTVVGTFQTPVAISSYADKIYVLDSATKCVTVFKFTDFGNSILAAQQSYVDGEYEECIAGWKAVLSQNSNYRIAYAGIAKSYIMIDDYSNAMYYAKLGDDQTTYSTAFTYYREELMSKYLLHTLIILAVVIVGIAVLRYFLKKRAKVKVREAGPVVRGLKFGGYVATHPFKGFNDMVREGEGNIISVIIIYVAYILVSLLSKQYKAFLFTSVTSEFNLLSSLSTIIVPVFLWCVCNWAVTTLTDGDGKPVQIMMATAYSLVPYIIAKLVCVPLTYVLTSQEAMFVTLIEGFGLVWSAALIVASNITIHDFTFLKALGTIVITIVGIFIVIFLALLVVNLVQQMLFFLISIYNQIIIRL